MKYCTRTVFDFLNNFPYEKIIEESIKKDDKWTVGYKWSPIGNLLQSEHGYPDMELVKNSVKDMISWKLWTMRLKKLNKGLYNTVSPINNILVGTNNLIIEISNDIKHVVAKYFDIKFEIDDRYGRRTEN